MPKASATNALLTESLYATVGGARLHVRRMRTGDGGAPVLMVHGAIENGRIFYSASGKGLGPFLAARGYDVYVGDLRGRGGSEPHIARGHDYGQTAAIVEDIPAMAALVAQASDHKPQHWIAHSWGGVLLASHLVRFPARTPAVKSLTCFGTKRTISVRNLDKLIGIDLVWNRLGPLSGLIAGFFPAERLGIGADDETRRSLSDWL